MKSFYTKSFDEMNKYILGLSAILVGIFVVYFYLVSQSWTELPFSVCTPIDSPYDDVFVPLELEGLSFMYSPDEGFNTCKTNILSVVTPFISLFAGVSIFGYELFNPSVEHENTKE